MRELRLCIGMYISDSDELEFDSGHNVSKFDSEMPIGESLPLATNGMEGAKGWS